MSTISNISDYESRLTSLLLGQFRTQTNWLSLFAAVSGAGSALQDLEDTAFSLWQQRSDLSLAVGRQLDQWGGVVRLPREGWTDTQYRARILVWLQVLRSTGTPDELIRIASDLTSQAIADVTYWETPPASYSLQFAGAVYGSDPDLAIDAAKYLARADPSGVGIGQIISLPATPFLFGSVGANGFSDAVTRGRFCVDVAAIAGV